MQELKVKYFSTPETLCNWVNSNQIHIVQISESEHEITLYYRKKD